MVIPFLCFSLMIPCFSDRQRGGIFLFLFLPYQLRGFFSPFPISSFFTPFCFDRPPSSSPRRRKISFVFLLSNLALCTLRRRPTVIFPLPTRGGNSCLLSPTYFFADRRTPFSPPLPSKVVSFSPPFRSIKGTAPDIAALVKNPSTFPPSESIPRPLLPEFPLTFFVSTR